MQMKTRNRILFLLGDISSAILTYHFCLQGNSITHNAPITLRMYISLGAMHVYIWVFKNVHGQAAFTFFIQTLVIYFSIMCQCV